MGVLKQITFNEYRYQILPISQEHHVILSDGITSIEKLKEKKNQIFIEGFHKIRNYCHSRNKVIHKILVEQDNISIFKIGVERDLKRKTKDFEIEDVENWESSIVIINNNPDVQKCLIQKSDAFNKTITLSKIFEKTL